MSLPTLLGPIDSGASFMIASLQNGTPFLLNSTRLSGLLIYYWESNLHSIINNNILPIFSSQSSLDSLIITDITNHGTIGFPSSTPIIGNTLSTSRIKMSQSSFATWAPPSIFLSMVPYTIFSSSGSPASIFSSIPGTGGTGPSIPATNLIILPVLWFFNCTSSGSYDSISTPPSSIVNWFCLSNPSISGCTGLEIAPSGWTNLSDCTAGDFYKYCPTGNLCGNSYCKGPCPHPFYDCNFVNSQYVCQFNIDNYSNHTPWWQSPYFIGIISAAIFITFSIILFIYLLARR